MQADAVALPLDGGSRREDLWGANYFPDNSPDECVEFTSLINIRPARDNRSMDIENEQTREKVRELVLRLLRGGSAP